MQSREQVGADCYGTVLVAGATGLTGRLVVAELRRRGCRVRVLSRTRTRARQQLGEGVEVHEGDVRDAASLAGIADGIDVAICTIGTRTYFGANGGAAVDAIGTAHLVAALGPLRHLVFLSAFGLDRPSTSLSEQLQALRPDPERPTPARTPLW